MPFFKKKPVVIEAKQVPAKKWDGKKPPMDWAELALWLSDPGHNWRMCKGGDAIEIETLEGTMRADGGDWIIKGVKGEFYPCKPDIFEATYEQVGP